MKDKKNDFEFNNQKEIKAKVIKIDGKKINIDYSINFIKKEHIKLNIFSKMN